MKSTRFLNLSLGMSILLLSGCATMIGGYHYKAHITVDRPSAKIIYQNEVKGTGTATLTVKRKEANKFTFSVQEEGCNEQQFKYTSRTFRGWAFTGSIFMGIYTYLIPIAGITDLATGALWKPNVLEKGVSKQNYKNFNYQVKYTNCVKEESEWLDIVYLKNGSIIKGKITEKEENIKMKIVTKEGNVFVFKVEEIEKITQESSK